MNTTTPSYLDNLLAAASDAVSSASSDAGIDAANYNDRILLRCIERQQRVIDELVRVVREQQAEVASLGRVLASRTEHLV